jgi:uncharacterized protein (DUF1800 family)
MERIKGAFAALLCLMLSAPSTEAFAQPPVDGAKQAARQSDEEGQLRGDERILQALNRFTFGARPGDVEAVRAMGLEKWFAQQLHPQAIDQAALEARLAEYPAMRWSTEDLLVRLPSNAMIRQAADGKVPIPQSGALHAVYENEIARRQIRQERKQQAAGTAAVAMSVSAPGQAAGTGQTAAGTGEKAARAETQPEAPPSKAQIEEVLALSPAQRVTRLATMQQADFDSFRKALKGPQRNAIDAGLDPAQKEVVAALENPQRVVNEELVAQRLTRDIYSNAQLQEVMTDFWLNHFNVYLHKNDETPYYLVSYERDVIRPRALGRFEDLLEATAHSPAMLLYLDNSSSMGPDSPAAEKAKIAAARHPDRKKPVPEGLNENYARELMELHTLGVNGGYTQADVIQVARVLTGWTVDKPQRGGSFKFDENRHEPGTKKVMGKKIKDHGEQEGEQLLHLLATRPATAKFISRELAIRFVGDDPPQALVNRLAKTYMKKSGDISAVLETLFHAPEFWSADAYRAKVKTPLEYVVSAARASNADIANMQPLTNALRDMGMPVYGAVPPTGYKWDAADWVSTGALVNRMNFALTLAANRLPGVEVSWTPPAGASTVSMDDGTAQPQVTANPMPTPQAEEQRLEALLVDGGVSATTRAAVLDQFDAQNQTPNPTQDRAMAKPVRAARAGNAPASALEKQDQLLAGLLLGSPEFQRR